MPLFPEKRALPENPETGKQKRDLNIEGEGKRLSRVSRKGKGTIGRIFPKGSAENDKLSQSHNQKKGKKYRESPAPDHGYGLFSRPA